MAFGILAGFAYCDYRNYGAAVIGFCLMIAWHVMDGADGQLARLTNTQSQFGKVLDGICDYVTFIAVYLGLAISMSRQDGPLVLIAIALAGACHAVQAAAYESRRQDYVFFGWGRGDVPAAIGAPAPSPKGAGWVARLLRIYETLQASLGGDGAFKRAFYARLAGNPRTAAAIRARYRARFAPALRQWSVLSANYRTLGIFIAALIGMPLLYFGFEIFGFSLILLVLARRQTAAAAAFIAGLDDGAFQDA